MVEIKIVSKMGSFTHVLKCISAKIDEKNRMVVTCDESGTTFIPE